MHTATPHERHQQTMPPGVRARAHAQHVFPVLLAATTTDAYPAAGWNWDPALLDTHNASRTGIVGEGTIDGQARGIVEA